MRTYIWVAQVRMRVVACFEQFIWTMHFEINKNFRFRNSSHRFSIWKPHLTIMPALGQHTIDQTCSFEQTLFQRQLRTYLFVGNMHFMCISVVEPICYWFFPASSACIVVFHFNSIIGTQETTVLPTTPQTPPPFRHRKVLLSMSNDINLLRWLIRAIIGTAIPFDVSHFHSLLCVGANSIFDANFNASNVIQVNSDRSTNRCQDLNSKEKPLKTKS